MAGFRRAVEAVQPEVRPKVRRAVGSGTRGCQSAPGAARTCRAEYCLCLQTCRDTWKSQEMNPHGSVANGGGK